MSYIYHSQKQLGISENMLFYLSFCWQMLNLEVIVMNELKNAIFLRNILYHLRLGHKTPYVFYFYFQSSISVSLTRKKRANL